MKKSYPIIEVFNSIEGEGFLMGQPIVFVRLSGCNLSCMFENSICDTAYASFTPEKGKYDLRKVCSVLDQYPRTNNLCISGGEPFLYPETMRDIMDLADEKGIHKIIVETNGTVSEYCFDLFRRVDMINISPKLSTSTPTQEKVENLGMIMTKKMAKHEEQRYNKSVIWEMIVSARDYRLKYVVGSEKDFEEIENQIKDIIDYDIFMRHRQRTPFVTKDGEEFWYDSQFILPRKVVLMPAGATNEQLNQNRKMVAEYCAQNGYCYSDRLQVLIWGTEKER